MSTERPEDAPQAAALDALLERTSRTFALTIPLLPEPTRRVVTTAYLLFRIADTFEDATIWPVDARTGALTDFAALLRDPGEAAAGELARRWVAEPPLRHAGYLDLLGQTPRVLAAFRDLRASARTIVDAHVQRTIRGMADYVERSRDGAALELRDVAELREYCYVVAGIVGEMLTELFLDEYAALGSVASYLRERSREFGEGLQLTNILKDSLTDATEGRRYLPVTAPREQVFELARRDLDAASEYVLAVQGCDVPHGLAAFNALPVLLAVATLDRVRDRGPGAKLTRPEVGTILAQMHRALESGEPVVSTPQAVRRR